MAYDLSGFQSKLQATIAALPAAPDPKLLLLIAKAIEGTTPSVALSDVLAASTAQQAIITAQGGAAVAAVNKARDDALAAIQQAGQGSAAASGISFAPGGNVGATNVQSAILELDAEKVAKAGDTMTGPLTLSSDPTAGLHAATKQYVDALSQGRKNKDSVRVATTASITLSGAQTVDGVALVAGDRVLVKDQTSPAQNGLYVVAAGVWPRALDADAWIELVSAFVLVEQGTVNADVAFNCTVDQGGTLGTTAVTWIKFGSLAGLVQRSGDQMAGALDFAATVSVASAATTDIGAAASNNVEITGTATVTSLGTRAAGALRWIRFRDAGLVLTHDAAALILPGAINITAQAGDTAVFRSHGTGWRCLSYQRADGSALTGSGGVAFTATTFATAIPFDAKRKMPRQFIGGALTFTPNTAGAVAGGTCYVNLVADGTNAPVFNGFAEWGGSAGFQNTQGILNHVQFFFDGEGYYWSATQDVNAQPIQQPATAYTLSGPSAVPIGSASSPFTVTAQGSLSSAVTVTPSDGGAGGAFSPASVTLNAGNNSSATFTYTASSAGSKTISTTNNGGLTNPNSLTVTAAAGTYTLSGPSTATVGQPSSAFTVASTGTLGSAVTVTPSDSGGGGSFSPSTVTLAAGTNTSATFTYTPASAGSKTVSTTNNGGLGNPNALTVTVTAAAAQQFLRYTNTSGLNEAVNGSGYNYTAASNDAGYGRYGTSTQKVPSGADGFAGAKLTGATASSIIVGVKRTATNAPFGDGTNGIAYGIFADTAQNANYYALQGSSIPAVDNSVPVAAGDILRVRRSGTTIIGEVSKDNGATYTPVKTWTGVAQSDLYGYIASGNTASTITQPFGSSNMA